MTVVVSHVLRVTGLVNVVYPACVLAELIYVAIRELLSSPIVPEVFRTLLAGTPTPFARIMDAVFMSSMDAALNRTDDVVTLTVAPVYAHEPASIVETPVHVVAVVNVVDAPSAGIALQFPAASPNPV